MHETEFTVFQEKWLIAHEISVSNSQPSVNAVNQAFNLLKPFSLANVTKAVSSHSVVTKFAPTPHDIIQILEDNGKESPYSTNKPPSPEELITLAKLANTPLGVIAKIKIGSFDLHNQKMQYLKSRALEILSNFENTIQRCVDGDYTSHEIETMIKYRVDPRSKLSSGLPCPSSAGVDKIVAEINRAKQYEIASKRRLNGN